MESPGDLNRSAPTILVVDLNCAFASIEQQHDPRLRGKPVAVAAYATGAGTIVSSSREARALGIKTGMRVYEGRALFPALVVMEPHPPRYREVSDTLIDILERHGPDVTRLSIDEASLDLIGTPDLKRLGPEGVGMAIKTALRAEVGEVVTCSIGISTSIWLAKIASNLTKIDGLNRIDHTNLVDVLGRLQLTDLPGIGEATARRLQQAGVATPLEMLTATTNNTFVAGMSAPITAAWSRRLRGFEVHYSGGSGGRKSYSHSHVLPRPTRSQADLEELLMRLCDMVGRRLRSGGRRAGTVTVSGVYRPEPGHFQKQAKQPEPISTGDEIYAAALRLLEARNPDKTVGTLGVALSALTEKGVIGDDDPLQRAIDKIRDRFGEDAVQPARLLNRARVVRDRIAFGNTGHPDEERDGG